MARVITWNIGGAKYLELAESLRASFRTDLTAALTDIVRHHNPDIVVLQEIVQFRRSGKDNKIQDLVSAPKGYYFRPEISIDTDNQSHPTKWSKYRKKGGWHEEDYLAQGYGIIWRSELRHGSIWEFPSEPGRNLKGEVVRLDTGLFTGTRDTEPRLAVVNRFTLDGDVDMFVVNLHLTTLNGEREGSPQIDHAASAIRQHQLDVVMHGVVARYNEWVNFERKRSIRPNPAKRRRPAIWVLAGDFNCIPNSAELNHLRALNFVNLNPKGGGTKGSGVPIKKGTITLDYIFAGPAYYALDPYIAESQAQKNPTPLDYIQVSDHFPVRADIPVTSKNIDA